MRANKTFFTMEQIDVAVVRRFFAIACLCVLSMGGALAQSPPPNAGAAEPAARPNAPHTTKDRAWRTLREGLAENSVEKRAKAVNALGLLTANVEAEKSASKALKDEKFPVRVAAAVALGSMRAVRAAADLQNALDDPEPTVVLAAANSLMTLNDAASAYDIYYGVLTGGMRTNRGLVQEQWKTLHDRKKLAELGLQQGVGFVPFGGVGYGVVKTVMKADQSVFRAEAAKKLAHDPDPVSAEALVGATKDKSTIVRVAAVQALSERGDKSQLPNVVLAMNDEKDEVRYAAAAATIHLSEMPGIRHKTASATSSGK
jgi:HEAT repeat protein